MATTSDARHETRECASGLTRAFSFLGKRWNGLLLSVLVGIPATYAELKRAVPGISDSMLSERLAELAQAGLLAREVEAGPPVSVTYRLTESGQALAPALEALRTWGEENLTDERCNGA